MDKKILFITSTTPGIQGGGGEMYTAELLKVLSQDFKIDLVYFQYPFLDKYEPANDNIKILFAPQVNTKLRLKGLLAFPYLFPLFSARYNKRIDEDLNSIAKSNNYCAIYFDFSQTFVYAKKIQHPFKILMSHDVIAQKYTRKQRYLLPWVKKSEGKLLRNGTVVFTFSDKDCAFIKEFYGVESRSTMFFLKKEVLAAVPRNESDYFVMFGSWGRPENYLALQWFIENVMPILKERIKIKVVGGGKMPDTVRSMVDNCDSIEYVGYVDNPYEIIANAIAEIAPLRYGAGVKVKCVEAMACGTPVIGTDVAFEGIPCYEGMSKMMIKAATVGDYVDSIVSINLDVEERIKLKNVFCGNYTNNAIVRYLKSL